MIKYTKEYIAKLLDKYMDGTSTLGEEDILADYFHRGNVPEEWADFQQLFQEIEAMKPQSKVRKRWIGWSVAASVAVLLVTIMWQQTEQQTGQHHTEKTSAVLTAKADTVSCSQVEQKTDTATFQKVQPQPVKIKKRRLRKPKPTMTDIDKTYALMAEAEQEVIEAQLAAHGYIPIMQEDGTIIYIHEQTKLLSYEE
jgi:hypothetical protein